MTLCICQHEERHHQRLAIPPGDDNEAGRCDKIGCYCELFRPDLEDYTDIKFGPIEESPIEGYGEEEIDRWIGRGYQELKAQIAALTAERDGLRALIGRVVEGLPHTSYYQYYGDTELRQLIKDCQEALK